MSWLMPSMPAVVAPFERFALQPRTQRAHKLAFGRCPGCTSAARVQAHMQALSRMHDCSSCASSQYSVVQDARVLLCGTVELVDPGTDTLSWWHVFTHPASKLLALRNQPAPNVYRQRIPGAANHWQQFAVACSSFLRGLPRGAPAPPDTPKKAPPARAGGTFWGVRGGRQPPRRGRAANRRKPLQTAASDLQR
eukprot:2912239-Alexandrium_andersonii.AAC.2